MWGEKERRDWKEREPRNLIVTEQNSEQENGGA